MTELLQKLHPHSQGFSDQIYFLDKLWLVLPQAHQTAQDAITYIFRSKEKVLIYAVNGAITKGKWEYLDYAHALVLEIGTESFMYNLGFLNSETFILKKQGIEDFLILVNESHSYTNSDQLLSALEQRYLTPPPSTTNLSPAPTPTIEESIADENLIITPQKPKFKERYSWLYHALKSFQKTIPLLVCFLFPLWLAAKQTPTANGSSWAGICMILIVVLIPLYIVIWIWDRFL